MNRLSFSEANHPTLGWGYEIYNSQDENIGSIRKIRIGAYMHWNLIVEKRHFEGCDFINFSPGCQDEIRAMCKKLKGEELNDSKFC